MRGDVLKNNRGRVSCGEVRGEGVVERSLRRGAGSLASVPALSNPAKFVGVREIRKAGRPRPAPPARLDLVGRRVRVGGKELKSLGWNPLDFTLTRVRVSCESRGTCAMRTVQY